jgi:hypothetical protein
MLDMRQSVSSLLKVTVCSVPFLTASTASSQTTVRVTNSPEWGSAVRLVEEIRVGSLDGAPETQFGMILAVEPRTNGGFFVFDAQVPVIRQFDERGRFIRNVGRSGGGPGEYARGVQGLRATRGNQLAVWDAQQARIVLFDSAGKHLRDIRVTGGAFFGDQAFGVDTAGNFYLKRADMSRVPAPRAGQMVLETDFPLTFLKVSPSGSTLDTLRLPQNLNSSQGFVLATPQGYRSNFMPESVVALSNRGYLVAGHTRTYSIEIRGPGSTTRTITRTVPSIPIVGEERGMWEAWTAFTQRRSQGEGMSAALQDLPRLKPAFRGIWIDGDGRIWVDRYVEARKVAVEPRKPGDERPLYNWREPPTFDVLTPEGRLLGTLVFPADTYVYAARGRYVWAETKGEDDVPQVVRFRIEGAR